MKTNEPKRTLISKGVSASYDYGIDDEDQVHIMMVLRDTLYKNAKLAVLREPGSNGWDANRKAERGHIPLNITLATPMEPTLVIRDDGPGMSEDEIRTVFTRFGKSTKRMDDRQTGTLGLGCKAPHAYTDSFFITSWNGGSVKSYVSVLDETNRGKIKKLSGKRCPSSKTGIEIRIPVKPADIPEFNALAQRIYRFYEPLPNINIELRPPKKQLTPFGYIFPEERGWTALMGCVSYELHPAQLKAELEREELWGIATRMSGALFFDIGEVHFSASREELKYDDETKVAVAAKFRSLVNHYIEETFTAFQAVNLTPWDKRLKAAFLSKDLKLKLTGAHSVWGATDPELYEGTSPPTTFVLSQEGSCKAWRPWKDGVRGIAAESSTRLILRDEHKRALKNYRFGACDYLITPLPGMTIEQVEAELDECLGKASMTGIPVVKLTDLPYSKSPSNGGDFNIKHVKRCFQLKPDLLHSSKKSQAWEVVDRVPTDSDVFLIISGFTAPSVPDLTMFVNGDQVLARLFKVELPPIFGYKTTADKPVHRESCTGIHYPEWRKKFWEPHLTSSIKLQLEAQGWVGMFNRMPSEHSHVLPAYNHLKIRLGEKHPITQAYGKHLESLKIQTGSEHLYSLSRLFPQYQQKAGKKLDQLREDYPLLFLGKDSIACFRTESFGNWVEYVLLKDKENELHDHLEQPLLCAQGQTLYGEQGGSQLHSLEGCPAQ